jgi:thiamine biosynthesis lipoprotein
VTGAALVDAGGDLYACGLPHGAVNWTVAVEDPLAPQRNAAVLEVGPGAVATSTTVRRQWKQRGQLRHHLIDPTTGEPADSLWISVTAVYPASEQGNEGARAEALAKAMLIGGPIRAAELIDTHPGSYFIAVDQNDKVWESVNLPALRAM